VKYGKRILALMLIGMMSVSCAAAEPLQMDFEGGFSVRLSQEWTMVETNDALKENGSFSMAVSRDGESPYVLDYRDERFSEPDYETEMIRWFKDDVPTLIPRGAQFTIKDVETGRIFQAVRFGGRNHMDTEPFSKEDSEIIKRIYGGKFNWDYRPILILYEGHVYAACMNSMPHSDAKVQDNDYAGHFCVHFKDSMLHEEWVVSEPIQKLVEKAGQASW